MTTTTVRAFNPATNREHPVPVTFAEPIDPRGAQLAGIAEAIGRVLMFAPKLEGLQCRVERLFTGDRALDVTCDAGAWHLLIDIHGRISGLDSECARFHEAEAIPAAFIPREV